MALVVGKGESRCASEHVGHENIRHPILSIFIWDGTLADLVWGEILRYNARCRSRLVLVRQPQRQSLVFW